MILLCKYQNLSIRGCADDDDADDDDYLIIPSSRKGRLGVRVYQAKGKKGENETGQATAAFRLHPLSSCLTVNTSLVDMS